MVEDGRIEIANSIKLTLCENKIVKTNPPKKLDSVNSGKWCKYLPNKKTHKNIILHKVHINKLTSSTIISDNILIVISYSNQLIYYEVLKLK